MSEVLNMCLHEDEEKKNIELDLMH